MATQRKRKLTLAELRAKVPLFKRHFSKGQGKRMRRKHARLRRRVRLKHLRSVKALKRRRNVGGRKRASRRLKALRRRQRKISRVLQSSWDRQGRGPWTPIKFYDPRRYRRNPPRTGGRSPWGKIQYLEVLAPGIVSVGTASHGGIWTDRAVTKAIEKLYPGAAEYAKRWSGARNWWEEDVAAIFPIIMVKPEHRDSADRMYKAYVIENL